MIYATVQINGQDIEKITSIMMDNFKNFYKAVFQSKSEQGPPEKQDGDGDYDAEARANLNFDFTDHLDDQLVRNTKHLN